MSAPSTVVRVRDTGRLFERRTLWWITAVGAVSLAAALLVALYPDDLSDTVSAGADSFSRSALGHRALTEALEAQGVTVLRSRHATGRRVRAGSVVLVAEPPTEAVGQHQHSDTLGVVMDGIEGDADVILVLPKWYGSVDPANERHIGHAVLRPLEEVETALRAAWPYQDSATISGSIIRPGGDPGAWSGPLSSERPDLDSPQLIDAAALDLEVTLGSRHGALIAHDGAGLWVISDPDLLNNAGLGRGHNARIVWSLLESLDASTVMVDETLHGFRRHPTVWTAILQFPLVLVTLHLIGVLVLALWSAVGRFGKPLPLPPRIVAGKTTLIDHTAQLLTAARHHRHSLARYWELTQGRAAQACGLPPGIGAAERAARLMELSGARGTRDMPRNLTAAVTALRAGPAERRAVRSLARRMHRWRQEITRQAPAAETRGPETDGDASGASSLARR